MEGNPVDCKNVYGLVTALNINHNPEGCRLFIDLSKFNIKAAVSHNGTVLSSITVQHAISNNKSYGNVKIIRNCINCNKYQWQLCGGLKVVTMFLGPQQGYIMICCLLCERDS